MKSAGPARLSLRRRPASKISRAAALDIVLPFANIGGGPEQEHFVDGITESLTTDLSRIRGSFVIGRNTAFTFKGKPVDLKQIGREMNVRYVLEGSVQRGGNRMRVNVQLIDAETGNHLWAERFDKPLGDLFDMQDEIVARLANQLGTELIAAGGAPRGESAEARFRGPLFSGHGVIQSRNYPLENMAQARVFLSAPWSLIRITSTHCSVSGESTPTWAHPFCRTIDPRG